MSGTRTENLGLFNTNMLTDGDDFLDFDRDLNQNNNILDAAIGKLSTLTTEEKTNLVAAINELVAGKSSIDLDNLSAIGQAIMDKKVEVEALLQQNGYAKFTWKENNEISNLTICWGLNQTYEDRNITFTYPIAFTTKPNIQLTTNYSTQVSELNLQPNVWFGNANIANCKIYGNSSVLNAGVNIWFDYLLIGY